MYIMLTYASLLSPLSQVHSGRRLLYPRRNNLAHAFDVGLSASMVEQLLEPDQRASELFRPAPMSSSEWRSPEDQPDVKLAPRVS